VRIPASAVRSGTVAVLVVAVAGLAIFFGGRALLHRASAPSADSGCAFGNFSLGTEQTAVASTMVGVVLRRDLPERAAVLVLAAGLQESHLRNLASGEGDRDSVGVLQQRPSQGWGTVAQLGDVQYATGKFLDALVKINGWQIGDLADTIQAIQISADGRLYAVHEPEAQALADALTGATPAGVSCAFPAPTTVASPQAAAAAVAKDLPVRPPTVTGQTVAVPGAAWATAAWFVSNGDRLGIERVSYSGKTWARGKGWSDDQQASATEVVATLRH